MGIFDLYENIEEIKMTNNYEKDWEEILDNAWQEALENKLIEEGDFSNGNL